MSVDNDIIITCPHCFGIVIVKETEINCKIFKHGVLKATNTQINPHSTEEECQYFVNNNLIYGCGKPFRIFKDEKWCAEICGYI